MMHAIDARTGFEVWAFIPFNLLPKLKTLLDGNPVYQFEYFVDSSPKVADVKLNGAWRTLLLFGEGPGGTFYQTLDVTAAGTGGPSPDSDDWSGVLGSFASGNTVTFLWAFPRYESFDHTISAAYTLTDGSPGGRIVFHGDLKASATAAEKSVGFTWSDPAVGPLDDSRTVNAAITGSGYFPPVEDSLPGRGNGAPRAGQSIYVLDVRTGLPIGNAAGGCSTSASGTGCLDLGEVNGNGRKNALQADITAASNGNSPVVVKAYAGDVDGNYWRFSLASSGAISKTALIAYSNSGSGNNLPIYGSSALMTLGSSDQYIFFATGSDQLPVTTTGGTGTFKLWGIKDNFPSAATTKFNRSLAAVTNVGGLATGERVTSAPAVAGDIVFFATSVENGSQPWSTPTSNLYALTYLGGAAYAPPGQTSVKNNSSPVAKTFQGRVNAPFIVDQHAYISNNTGTGVSIDVVGDPEDFNNGVGQIGVRILSWREVR
jgi:Tfp pilus tip-associated adhesin PilY1